MLSLPDEWNYTTRGLAAICREGVDLSLIHIFQQENSPLRAVIHGKLVSVSETLYDTFILRELDTLDDEFKAVSYTHLACRRI